MSFTSGKQLVYTTYFGNRIHFVIWASTEFDNHIFGAKILDIQYAVGDARDTLSDAGNEPSADQFLSGSILRSTADGAMEIRNPALGTTLTLDWSNPGHLVRTSEDGRVDQAGRDGAGKLFEVWVDFAWTGPSEGDFYRPFKTLAAAVDAVASGGVVKVVPGTSRDRTPIRHPGKSCRIVAPLGSATMGA